MPAEIFEAASFFSRCNFAIRILRQCRFRWLPPNTANLALVSIKIELPWRDEEACGVANRASRKGTFLWAIRPS